MGGSVGPKGKYDGLPRRRQGKSSDPSSPDRTVDCERVEPEALEETSRETAGALCRICYRPDGWLRFAPDADQGVVFIKFKFTCNRFYNHYVMVVIEPMFVDEGVRLLEEKIDQCYAGARKPVLDQYFKSL